MKKESDITVLHYTKNVIDLAQHLELIDNLSFFEDWTWTCLLKESRGLWLPCNQTSTDSQQQQRLNQLS